MPSRAAAVDGARSPAVGVSDGDAGDRIRRGQVLHPLGQLAHVDGLRQIPELVGSHRRLHLQVPSDVLQQLQHGRQLPFGQQVDLKVEVTALVGLLRQAILAGQDEERRERAVEVGEGISPCALHQLR